MLDIKDLLLVVLISFVVAYTVSMNSKQEQFGQCFSELQNLEGVARPPLHCDTSLGQAPLGNPQTWEIGTTPIIQGMY